MDKVTDFFRDIRDRLSNPLLSSFIISWLIINWKIPISLFFYSNDALKIDGYSSYMDLVIKNYSIKNYIINPFLLALAYTFIFPFIRNGILAFQSWIKRWGNDLNLRISKRGKVSMERFIQLREKYLTQTKVLEDLFLDEGKHLASNKTLNAENLKLSTQNNSLSHDLSYWQSMNEQSILYGEWDFTIRNSERDIAEKFRLSIMGGKVYCYSDASKRIKANEYHITDFFCNPNTSKLCFILSSTTDGKSLLHNLSFPNGISEFTGLENHTKIVVYKKLKE